MGNHRIGRVAAALFASALVAGAGPGFAVAGAGMPSTSGQPAAASEPHGQLTVGYSYPPASLDPIAPLQFETYLSPLYDRLTEITDDLEIRPRLAESWSFPDEHTMLLELRQGVVFHDGTPFDADAVKVNLDRSRAEGSALATILSGIDSVNVVDDDTVELVLSHGGSELPAIFARLAGMMISPTVITVDPDSIAHGAGGSGPYLLEEYRADESVSYLPNPDHWDPLEGRLEHLTITGITVGQQRFNALDAGDVDLILVTGPDVAAAIRGVEDETYQGRIVEGTAGQNVLALRSALPPFDNPLVREAVAYAIDKVALQDGLYQGTCVAADQFYPEGHFAHDEALDDVYDFDPDHARQLLEESGVADLSFTIDYLAVYSEPAVALQQMLNDVGFNVEVNEVASTDLRFYEGTRQAYVGAFFGIVDPSQLVGGYLLGGSTDVLDDPDGEAAALLAEATDPTLDEAARGAAYDEIWQRSWGEHLVISLCRARQAWLHTGSVANLDDLRYTFMGTVDVSYLEAADR